MAIAATTDMANKHNARWFNGWLGFVPQHSNDDYHVDSSNHLPLEELAKTVADQQKRHDRHSRT